MTTFTYHLWLANQCLVYFSSHILGVKLLSRPVWLHIQIPIGNLVTVNFTHCHIYMYILLYLCNQYKHSFKKELAVLELSI